MRSRRALLYVPGDDTHKIQKALTFEVDSLCLDMEDGVAQNRKAEARATIVATLRQLPTTTSEVLTRINPVGSGLESADLAAALDAHPLGIVLPKVESLEQVQWVCGQIEAAELEHNWPANSIRLLIGIETPRAILSLKEITSLAQPPAPSRLSALIFGGEDYAASIGATRTTSAQEVFTARSLVVMHAKACGLQAIDMVTVDYQDLERLQSEAVFGASLGYTGKQVIHPDQVAPVQQAFTPSADAIARATQLVEAFIAHQQAGKGAFGLNGQMIDLPLVRAAENVLAQARQANK